MIMITIDRSVQIRWAFGMVLLAGASLAGAQAYKCVDPGSGRTLYTDQPCARGALVVPRPSAEEVQERAERAEAARERAEHERAASELREQQRAAERAAAEAARAPSDSPACHAARQQASKLAADMQTSEEQMRTARANAALACGQPPPPEIVIHAPPIVRRVPPHRPGRIRIAPPASAPVPAVAPPAPWPRPPASRPPR